jgi:cytochrome P450
MTMTTSDLHFDMYDRGIHAPPYPVYRRLRDEAPLYRNDEYDFFVVSRFDDVSRVLSDREVFLSGRGNVYNILAEDVELHGQVIPAGSTIVALPGSANRDERHFDDADTFDIRREPGQIMTFSFGPHYCLGASLAKVEMRIALEAVLERFPEWTVDHAAATMIGGIDMRGWDTLPVEVVER